MSSRAHRRRFKSSVSAKQAFEENEDGNKSNIEEKANNHRSSSDANDVNFDPLFERAFFSIDNSTVEVILDNNVLSWSRISGKISGDNIHAQKISHKDHINSIDLHDVYAIMPVYSRSGWLLNNHTSQANISPDSSIHGFQLHSYERLDDNILQEIQIIFQSNMPNQIQRWYRLVSNIISEHKPSRNILVICNPYAGASYGRHVYNTNIKPMLERAQYNVTYSEINEMHFTDEVLSEFEGDFDSLYGLVVIGGDGSVINVINALLRYLARENRTRLNRDHDLPSLPFPISIVPTGTTNIICHSINGNTDYCTPIFHLLFNRQMKIDMSAIFDVHYDFVTANFSAGAGYGANALKYFTRYSMLSPKKMIQKSFVKAASKKNLKSVEMEIRYIPADEKNTDAICCYQGCPICAPATTERTTDQVKIFDDTHVQKMEKRRKPSASDNSNHNRPLSSLWKNPSNQQNASEQHWKTLHHSYLHVAILTNANLWSFAPQGLAKFGHLADGLLDLVLTEQTTRKDFVRFIKRHGNAKNQHEFSFTHLIKVKEIEIELKYSDNNLTTGRLQIDNQPDSSLSNNSSDEEQFNNENKSSSAQKVELHSPNGSLSEESRRRRRRHHHLHEQTQESSKNMNLSNNPNSLEQRLEKKFDSSQIDSSSSTVPFRRKTFFQSLKLKKNNFSLSRSSSVHGSNRINKEHNQRSADGTLRSTKSFLHLLTGGNSSSEKHEPASARAQDLPSATADGRRRSSAMSRLSCVEYGKRSMSVNNEYQNKKQPCMWNLDFTPYNSPLIRIKCFHRFLPVFGVGPSSDTELKEVNHSCFGRLG